MNTRLTIDFKDPVYLTRLKFLAAQEHLSLREIIVKAVDACFSDYLENRALAKLAEQTFAEWDNPQDSEYDKL